MSSMQATVAAISLSQTDLDKFEVLDRSKNNWGVWSDRMQNYLLLKHGGGYILGLVTRPDPSLDPVSAGHWDLDNLCIVAALRTRSSPEENEFLRGYTNAYLAWNALKSRHEKVGPIAQILFIQPHTIPSEVPIPSPPYPAPRSPPVAPYNTLRRIPAAHEGTRFRYRANAVFSFYIPTSTNGTSSAEEVSAPTPACGSLLRSGYTTTSRAITSDVWFVMIPPSQPDTRLETYISEPVSSC